MRLVRGSTAILSIGSLALAVYACETTRRIGASSPTRKSRGRSRACSQSRGICRDIEDGAHVQATVGLDAANTARRLARIDRKCERSDAQDCGTAL